MRQRPSFSYGRRASAGSVPRPVIRSGLSSLRASLFESRTIALDFETIGLIPDPGKFVGVGIYIPQSNQAWYFNVGHVHEDPRFSKVDLADVAALLGAWMGEARNRLIAHNVVYELQWIHCLGIIPSCRIGDSLIWTHRTDENLRPEAREPTKPLRGYKLNYGLKTLMRVYFGIIPPGLNDASDHGGVALSDPLKMARYCVADCINSWRLFVRAVLLMRGDRALRRVLREIEGPYLLPHAAMLREGIVIDTEEVRRQMELYETIRERCREEILRLAGTAFRLDSPRHVLAMLQSLEWDVPRLYHGPLMRGAVFYSRKELVRLLHATCIETNRVIISHIIQRDLLAQRISSYLKPFAYHEGRLRFERFSSAQQTTRFSCRPNLHGLPGKADEGPADKCWQGLLTDACQIEINTRDILATPENCSAVAIDLAAAEPRYMALVFQAIVHARHYHDWKRARQVLRARRRERWPCLSERMRETRCPYRGPHREPKVHPALPEDPLYRVFKHGEMGGDPYHAFCAGMMPIEHARALEENRESEWFAGERWRGKLATLALSYGSSAESLAPKLLWTPEQAKQAIQSLEGRHPALNILREEALLSVLHTGQVRSLWGHPRRLNGYYQALNTFDPIRIGFHRGRGNAFTRYEAEIVVLDSFRQGLQCFVRECVRMREYSDGSVTRRCVLRGTDDGRVSHIDRHDVFVRAEHFNNLPFRNISYRSIDWVDPGTGLLHFLGRQERMKRQALNAIMQVTGAIHLRWIVRNVDHEVIRHGFDDCRLFMHVHDSLEFYVPDAKVDAFIDRVVPVITRRPPWSDIDFKVSVEVGKRFGSMREVR